jgi:HK97 family phage major capsid protein
MLGILNDTAIGQTTAAGAVAWSTFSGEVDTIRQANYEPNAYVCEPAIMHAVMESTDNNGLWLAAPPTLEGLRGYSTSNCPSGEAVVGDFSQAAFCMRHGLRIEISTQAGDVFSKHQVAIKLYMRVDFGVLNAAAFRRVSGITAS